MDFKSRLFSLKRKVKEQKEEDEEIPNRKLVSPIKKQREVVAEMPNLSFYSNKLASRPRGGLIDDIHKKWFGDWDLLEEHHGYIQWLFPVFENGGLNWESKALTKSEAKQMRQDLEIANRIIKSYELMLHFYGMELKDPKTGEIVRAPHWKSRYQHLNSSFHNFLRINRILTSLGHLDFSKYKKPFVVFLTTEIETNKQLTNASNSLYKFWQKTLEIDSKEFLRKTLETPQDREDSIYFK